MKTVSIVEFRRNTESAIQSLRKGIRMVLTYRGKPVARLEPIEPEESDEPADSDPFYSMGALAKKWDSTKDKSSLSNEEIDQIVYGL